MQVRNLGCVWRVNAVSNPRHSRFRGNDGVKIGNNNAIIASLRPLRLRAIASNFLCQHALASAHPYSSWLDFKLWLKAQSVRIAILKSPDSDRDARSSERRKAKPAPISPLWEKVSAAPPAGRPRSQGRKPAPSHSRAITPPLFPLRLRAIASNFARERERDAPAAPRP